MGTGIWTNQDKILQEPSLTHRLFGIGWDRHVKYGKQMVVIMQGMQKEEEVLWVAELILFTSVKGDGFGGDSDLSCVKYMEVTNAVFGVDR